MGAKVNYKEGTIVNGFKILRFVENINGNRAAEFKCECGNLFKVAIYCIKSGKSSSCGCLHRKRLGESHRTHGHTIGKNPSKEYYSWQAMKFRCTNPLAARYKDYGARGITVCDRWLNSFENFFEDMGNRPSKNHTLERVDNNKGYSKENCRWATPKEQSNNRRSCKLIEYKGVEKTLKQWAEEFGLNYGNIHKRIYKSGWSIEDAFTLGRQHGSRYVSKRKVA